MFAIVYAVTRGSAVLLISADRTLCAAAPPKSSDSACNIAIRCAPIDADWFRPNALDRSVNSWMRGANAIRSATGTRHMTAISIKAIWRSTRSRSGSAGRG